MTAAEGKLPAARPCVANPFGPPVANGNLAPLNGRIQRSEEPPPATEGLSDPSPEDPPDAQAGLARPNHGSGDANIELLSPGPARPAALSTRRVSSKYADDNSRSFVRDAAKGGSHKGFAVCVRISIWNSGGQMISDFALVVVCFLTNDWVVLLCWDTSSSVCRNQPCLCPNWSLSKDGLLIYFYFYFQHTGNLCILYNF